MKMRKDGEPRIRIVFNGAKMSCWNGSSFEQINPQERFKDLIIDLRRKPTNTFHIKLVMLWTSFFQLIPDFFDILGAYLWTRLPNGTFVWAPQEIRNAVANMLPSHSLFRDKSYVCPLEGGLYGYTVVGDLWHDLLNGSLCEGGWEQIDDSLHLFSGVPEYADFEKVCVIAENQPLNDAEKVFVDTLRGRNNTVVTLATLAIFVDDGCVGGVTRIKVRLRELLDYLFELKEWLAGDVPRRMLSLYEFIVFLFLRKRLHLFNSDS